MQHLTIAIDTLLVSLVAEYSFGQLSLCSTRAILNQKEQYLANRSHLSLPIM